MIFQDRRLFVGFVTATLIVLIQSVAWPVEPFNGNDDVPTRISNTTFLLSFRYEKCQLYISGLTSLQSTTLLHELEKSPFLKEVESVGPTYKDPVTGKEAFTFKAKIQSDRCK